MTRLRYLRAERIGRLVQAHCVRRLAHAWSGTGEAASQRSGLIWQTGQFLRCDEAMRAGWSSCLASTASATVEKADAILRGQIKLFPGYEIETRDGNIPWHVGPTVSGEWRQWSKVYWADISIYKAGMDPKVTWELNRCQHLQVLGRAYRLTGDQRYAAAAAHQVRHWIEHNPFEVGINWWGILDVAIRAISWAWTADLCAPSPAWASEEMQWLLSISLRQHAEHLSRYLEWHPRPDTHTLGEALGLVILGIGFGQKGPARRWLERGVRTLCECARRQFTSEGVYCERNLQYHAYALEYYLHAAVLAKRHSLHVDVDLDAILTAALEATVALAGPDGILPEIGDDDGGRGSALDNRRGGRDVRPLVALAAAHLSLPVKMPLQDSDWELATWLLGEAETEWQKAHAAEAKGQNRSIFLPEAGYAVQRAGDRTLWMRCGPLGLLPYAGHGHADLLHVVIQTENSPQLIDAGTYTYNGDPQWRWYFRSTPAHNTLTVNGASQARPGHRFSWQTVPRCRNATWLSHPVFDWISAEHAAYEGIVHWRGVLFVRPEYWLIFDELRGSGVREVALFFHFPASAIVEVTDDEEGIRSTSGLSLKVLTAASGTRESKPGRWSRIEGWTSPGYGVRVPIPTARYEWQGALPLRTVILVCPGTAAQLASVQGEGGESSDVPTWTIRTPEREDMLLWNPGSLVYPIGSLDLAEGIAFWQSTEKMAFVYQARPIAAACVTAQDSQPLFLHHQNEEIRPGR